MSKLVLIVERLNQKSNSFVEIARAAGSHQYSLIATSIRTGVFGLASKDRYFVRSSYWNGGDSSVESHFEPLFLKRRGSEPRAVFLPYRAFEVWTDEISARIASREKLGLSIVRDQKDARHLALLALPSLSIYDKLPRNRLASYNG